MILFIAGIIVGSIVGAFAMALIAGGGNYIHEKEKGDEKDV